MKKQTKLKAKMLWVGVGVAASLAGWGGGGGGGSDAGGDGGNPGGGGGGGGGADSSLLALANERNEDGTFTLFAVDTDTGSRTQLDTGGLAAYQAPSAGERVVFSRATQLEADQVSDRDLFSVALDGQGSLQLSDGPSVDRVYAIVGDRVVFHRTSGGNVDVRSVKLDGSLPVSLADNSLAEEKAVRIAGDLVILETRLNGSTDTNLEAIRVDGTGGAVAIANSAQDERFLDVVGEFIVYSRHVESQIAGDLKQILSKSLVGDANAVLLADAKSDVGEAAGNTYAGYLGNRIFLGVHSLTADNVSLEQHIDSINVDGTDHKPRLVDDAFPPKLVGDRLLFSRHSEAVKQLWSAAADGSGEALKLTDATAATFIDAVGGDTVVVHRDEPMVVGGIQRNIYALRLTPTGALELPLAVDPANESFKGITSRRVLIERELDQVSLGGRKGLLTATLDGSSIQELLPNWPADVEFVRTLPGLAPEGRVVVKRHLTPPGGGGVSTGVELVAVDADGGNLAVLTTKTIDVSLAD